jgi:hypothetical protein
MTADDQRTGLAAEGALALELRPKGLGVLLLAGLLALAGRLVAFVRPGGGLLIEFAPFLLCPAKLLYRRGQVEEVDRNYVRPGPEVGVADQGVELPAGLRQALVDLLKTLALFAGVPVAGGQGALLLFEA